MHVENPLTFKDIVQIVGGLLGGLTILIGLLRSKKDPRPTLGQWTGKMRRAGILFMLTEPLLLFAAVALDLSRTTSWFILPFMYLMPIQSFLMVVMFLGAFLETKQRGRLLAFFGIACLLLTAIICRSYVQDNFQLTFLLLAYNLAGIVFLIIACWAGLIRVIDAQELINDVPS